MKIKSAVLFSFQLRCIFKFEMQKKLHKAVPSAIGA